MMNLFTILKIQFPDVIRDTILYLSLFLYTLRLYCGKYCLASVMALQFITPLQKKKKTLSQALLSVFASAITYRMIM